VAHEHSWRWRARSSSAGFALIVVLWILVLIGFITSQILATARLETKIAGNLVANAAAKTAADGAIHQAIFSLLDPRPDVRWRAGEPERELAIGDYRVTVQAVSEASRINPQLASPALFEALLQVTGTDAATARRLATAVKEWIGASTIPPDTVLESYRAAGLDYGPPSEPMQTIDELQYVLGMTPEIYAAIRPHLSLFAPAAPDLAQADPVVAAAIAATGQARSRPPPVLPGAGNTVVVRIIAEARSAKARAQHTAVVRLEMQARTYTMLAWYDEPE
jgi:general secretion pathway protein K